MAVTTNHAKCGQLLRKVGGGGGAMAIVALSIGRRSVSFLLVAGIGTKRRFLSRIAQLDQRTALPDQCLHSAEADVRPPRRKSGFGPTAGLAVQGVGCRRGNAPAGRTNATCKKAERGLSPIAPDFRRSDRPVT